MEEYNGQLKNGRIHGQGTLKWKNGDVYTGKFENNLRVEGKMAYREGSIYKTYNGEWKNGRLEWKNGDVYKGDFRDGKMHGWGKKKLAGDTTASDSKLYEFSDGELVERTPKE